MFECDGPSLMFVVRFGVFLASVGMLITPALGAEFWALLSKSCVCFRKFAHNLQKMARQVGQCFPQY
jgi:hypothetical protein